MMFKGVLHEDTQGLRQVDEFIESLLGQPKLLSIAIWESPSKISDDVYQIGLVLI